MATMKSNIPYSDAESLARRVCDELGTHTEVKSGYLKMTSQTTGFRIYMRIGRMLGAIDTNLPVNGQEGTYGLDKPNGSITCHIVPTLENLERFLRMAADPATGKLQVNKPRPFSFVKGPAPRTPNPAAIQTTAGVARRDGDKHPVLLEKLNALQARQKLAKARRRLEELGIQEDLVDDVVNGTISEEDAIIMSRGRNESEIYDVIAETGIMPEDSDGGE